MVEYKTSEDRRASNRKYYAHHNKYMQSGKGKETVRAWATKRRNAFKSRAVEYLGGVCVDCGLVACDVVVYDFHHLDPSTKHFEIGSAFTARPWEEIQTELDKCILLCSNCHRIREYGKGCA